MEPGLGSPMKKLILVAMSALGAVAAQAQILLNIDMTNPSATTITATTGASLISSSGTNFRIRLRNFYASFPGGLFGVTQPSSGNLRPALSTQLYDQVLRRNPSDELSISGSSGFNQVFVAGQQAFTGGMTVNLTEGAAFLRTSSFVGDIEVVNNFSQPTGQIVGQYSLTAVPEPATMTALGLGALALLRRRRKS